MKKKVIIITSIILTILAVAASSVYALWYISVNRKINPQDVTEDVVEAYIKDECNKTYTYGGGASLTSSPNAQLPLSSKLDNSQLTYSYKLSTDTTYSNANFNASNNTVSNGPIDAGTYDIKVSYNKTTTNEDGTSKTEVITISNISFSITPKELDISSLTPTNSSNLVYNGTSLTPTYDISSIEMMFL